MSYPRQSNFFNHINHIKYQMIDVHFQELDSIASNLLKTSIAVFMGCFSILQFTNLHVVYVIYFIIFFDACVDVNNVFNKIELKKPYPKVFSELKETVSSYNLPFLHQFFYFQAINDLKEYWNKKFITSYRVFVALGFFYFSLLYLDYQYFLQNSI